MDIKINRKLNHIFCMKRYNHIIIKTTVILSIITGLFTACKNEENLEFPYLFRPVNFAVELNKTVATLTWASVDSAKSYTLQISQDSLFKSVLVDTTLAKLTFVKELGGETKYFARVRANASDVTKNSKFNSTLSFTTPKENIFTGFGTNSNTGKVYSAYMTGFNTLTIKWQPGANTTHLILLSADGAVRDSVPLSASQITSGVAVVPALKNSNWKVQIYNKTFLRGTTYGLIEGDVLVHTGEDLVTALNSATSGQVVLLEGGATFTVGSSAYIFTKSVKIRSTSTSLKSVICMTSGTPTTTSNSLGIGAAMDSLIFENIDFTGYCDNNSSSTKIGYLFNNKTGYTVGDIKFRNCNIHNFGNSPFRLSGGNHRITNLVFNGCIINESGFSSGYAIVNISKSADYIDNISFLNSTLYNFSYPVISIVQSAATTMNSVIITNCTFNQTTQNTGASRVLFNFDYMNITNGIAISKCIFGSSGATTAGLKATNGTATPTLSGSYYTSDFVDETLVGGANYSMKAKMTAYSGAANALWNNPTNGDFSLKDNTFAGKGIAGDLRW